MTVSPMARSGLRETVEVLAQKEELEREVVDLRRANKALLGRLSQLHGDDHGNDDIEVADMMTKDGPEAGAPWPAAKKRHYISNIISQLFTNSRQTCHPSSANAADTLSSVLFHKEKLSKREGGCSRLTKQPPRRTKVRHGAVSRVHHHRDVR